MLLITYIKQPLLYHFIIPLASGTDYFIQMSNTSIREKDVLLFTWYDYFYVNILLFLTHIFSQFPQYILLL